MRALPHQSPRGGLAHRVFGGCGPRDQLRAALAFEPQLSEAQLAFAQSTLDAWSARSERFGAEEPVHCAEPFLSPRTLRIEIHNLKQPQEALAQLVDLLAEALPLREGHFSRWVAIEGREAPALALDPDAPEELTRFPKHEDYLHAVFEAHSAPPASEYETQVQGAFESKNGDIVLEDRGVPLYLPPLRIGYGTARAQFAPPDSRSGEVLHALTASFERAFSPLAAPTIPHPSNRQGALDAIDRVDVDGRRGHSFAIASTQLVQRLAATRFRYREHELFEALNEVAKELKLAPIVTWQRFGKPFAKEWTRVELHVFQLWEKSG